MNLSNLIYQHLFSKATDDYLSGFQIEGKNIHKSCARDHIMWMFLQCLFSKSNFPYDYLAFLKLYDHLYPDTEMLPVPDPSNSHCVISLAVSNIWVHMHRRCSQSTDQKAKTRPIPSILRDHLMQVNIILLMKGKRCCWHKYSMI